MRFVVLEALNANVKLISRLAHFPGSFLQHRCQQTLAPCAPLAAGGNQAMQKHTKTASITQALQVESAEPCAPNPYTPPPVVSDNVIHSHEHAVAPKGEHDVREPLEELVPPQRRLPGSFRAQPVRPAGPHHEPRGVGGADQRKETEEAHVAEAGDKYHQHRDGAEDEGEVPGGVSGGGRTWGRIREWFEGAVEQ